MFISALQALFRFWEWTRGDALASLRACPWLSYCAPSALKTTFLFRFGVEAKLSPGVPQPGGDAVDRGGKGVVQVVVILTATFPPQQLNLN